MVCVCTGMSAVKMYNYKYARRYEGGKARMSSVTILIPARHRLDHEKDYNK